MTEEQIMQLHQEMADIIAEYIIFQKRNIVERIKKLIPQIQEFILWFLNENQFGIEQSLYDAMSQNLLLVLEDILTSLQNEDKVLMYDVIVHGLTDYLECFVGSEAGVK